MFSLTNSLTIIFQLSLMGITFVITSMNGFRTGPGKVLVLLGVFGSLILSIMAFWAVCSMGAFEVDVIKWFSLGELDFRIGFYVDEFSSGSLVAINLLTFMVFSSSLALRRRKEIDRFGKLFILCALAASIASIAGNFITYIGAILILGIGQGVTLGIYDDNKGRDSNLITAIIIKFSEVLIILGLLGFMNVFGTDMFITFKGQQALIEEGMRSEVILFSLSIVMGVLIRTMQFPLIGWAKIVVRGESSVIKILLWCMHIIPIIVLLSRLSFIFMNMGLLLPILTWTGAISLLMIGLLALGEDSKTIILGYIYFGMAAICIILLGYALYVSALILFTVGSISFYAIYLLIEEVPNKKKSLKELPYSVKISAVLLFLFGMNAFGTPGWASIERLVHVAILGGTSDIIILVLIGSGYICLSVAFWRLFINRLLCFGTSWNDNGIKYYIGLTVFVLLALTVVLIKTFNINGINLDVITVINKATLGRYLTDVFPLLELIITTLIVVTGPLIVLYIYILKKEEKISLKFVDSFPGVWSILKKGLYLESFLHTMLCILLERMNVRLIRLGHKKNIAFQKISRAGGRIIVLFQGESRVELDNFFLVTMAGVLVINGLLVLSFIFKVW